METGLDQPESDFSQYRSSQLPPLPRCFHFLKTKEYDFCSEDILLFPNYLTLPSTSQPRSILRFHSYDTLQKNSLPFDHPRHRICRNVGILFAGENPSSGMHNIVAGIYKHLESHLNSRPSIYGFINGIQGLTHNDHKVLTWDIISPYLNTGGCDLLGIKAFKATSNNIFHQCAQTCQTLALQALVIIGESTDIVSATYLSQYFQQEKINTSVIIIPHSRDGNATHPSLIPITLGFDSSAHVLSEYTSNISQDSTSSKKYYHFIKGGPSFLQLETALRVRPTCCILNDEAISKGWTLEEVIKDLADKIMERRQKIGKRSGTILLADNLVELLPQTRQVKNEILTLQREHNNILSDKELLGLLSRESRLYVDLLPNSVKKALLSRIDVRGDPLLLHIETERLVSHLVNNEIKRRGELSKPASTPVSPLREAFPCFTFASKTHCFENEAKCPSPTLFDSILGYALGFTAVALMTSGKTGYLATIVPTCPSSYYWDCYGVPSEYYVERHLSSHVPKPSIGESSLPLANDNDTALSIQRPSFSLTKDAPATSGVVSPPVNILSPSVGVSSPPIGITSPLTSASTSPPAVISPQATYPYSPPIISSLSLQGSLQLGGSSIEGSVHGSQRNSTSSACKAVIHRCSFSGTSVILKSSMYKMFEKKKSSWLQRCHYRCIGPAQYDTLKYGFSREKMELELDNEGVLATRHHAIAILENLMYKRELFLEKYLMIHKRSNGSPLYNKLNGGTALPEKKANHQFPYEYPSVIEPEFIFPYDMAPFPSQFDVSLEKQEKELTEEEEQFFSKYPFFPYQCDEGDMPSSLLQSNNQNMNFTREFAGQISVLEWELLPFLLLQKVTPIRIFEELVQSENEKNKKIFEKLHPPKLFFGNKNISQLSVLQRERLLYECRIPSVITPLITKNSYNHLTLSAHNYISLHQLESQLSVASNSLLLKSVFPNLSCLYPLEIRIKKEPSLQFAGFQENARSSMTPTEAKITSKNVVVSSDVPLISPPYVATTTTASFLGSVDPTKEGRVSGKEEESKEEEGFMDTVRKTLPLKVDTTFTTASPKEGSQSIQPSPGLYHASIGTSLLDSHPQSSASAVRIPAKAIIANSMINHPVTTSSATLPKHPMNSGSIGNSNNSLPGNNAFVSSTANAIHPSSIIKSFGSAKLSDEDLSKGENKRSTPHLKHDITPLTPLSHLSFNTGQVQNEVILRPVHQRDESPVQVVPSVEASPFLSNGTTASITLGRCETKHMTEFGRSDIMLMPPDNKKTFSVGVCFAGPQAPGGLNIIHGLYDYFNSQLRNFELIGIMGGLLGLINGYYMKLDSKKLAMYKNQGGLDLLCRTKEHLRSAEEFSSCMNTCNELKLSSIIIIGDNTSLATISLLSEYFLSNNSPTSVFAVPMAVESSIPYIEAALSYSTVCLSFASIVGSLISDSKSSQSWYIIRMLGRSSSKLCVEVANFTHPAIVLLSEEVFNDRMTLSSLVHLIADIIEYRSNNNIPYGVILLSDSLLEGLPEINALFDEINTLSKVNKLVFDEVNDQLISNFRCRLTPWSDAVFSILPKRIQMQLLTMKDSMGLLDTGAIETEVLIKKLLEKEMARRKSIGTFKKGSFICKHHHLAYQSRSALPCALDCDLGYTLGVLSGIITQTNLTGYCCTVNDMHEDPENWQCVYIPLSSIIDVKMIDKTAENNTGTAEKNTGPLAHPSPMNDDSESLLCIVQVPSTPLDLEGDMMRELALNRSKWAKTDCGKNPGPIQFSGPFERRPLLSLTSSKMNAFRTMQEISSLCTLVKSLCASNFRYDTVKTALSSLISLSDVLFSLNKKSNSTNPTKINLFDTNEWLSSAEANIIVSEQRRALIANYNLMCMKKFHSYLPQGLGMMSRGLDHVPSHIWETANNFTRQNNEWINDTSPSAKHSHFTGARVTSDNRQGMDEGKATSTYFSSPRAPLITPIEQANARSTYLSTTNNNIGNRILEGDDESLYYPHVPLNEMLSKSNTSSCNNNIPSSGPLALNGVANTNVSASFCPNEFSKRSHTNYPGKKRSTIVELQQEPYQHMDKHFAVDDPASHVHDSHSLNAPASSKEDDATMHKQQSKGVINWNSILHHENDEIVPSSRSEYDMSYQDVLSIKKH